MPIILAERRPGVADYVRMWMALPGCAKLMEHSYKKNADVQAFEYMLSPSGMAYRSRVVWAGDYADVEPGVADDDDGIGNLYYSIREGDSDDKLVKPPRRSTTGFRYIVNHDKCLYVDKEEKVDGCETNIHPLPLLTAEGNGRGGGDFRGFGIELVGTWARDTISVEVAPPAGYTRLVAAFEER